MPRHTPPGVDAFKPQFFVRIELTAYRGIDSVTGEHDRCTHRRQFCAAARLLEQNRGAAIILNDSGTAMVEHKVFFAKPHFGGIVKNGV